MREDKTNRKFIGVLVELLEEFFVELFKEFFVELFEESFEDYSFWK